MKKENRQLGYISVIYMLNEDDVSICLSQELKTHQQNSNQKESK